VATATQADKAEEKTDGTAPDSVGGKPVRVIFIAGWGHSGSTLLGQAISTAPNVLPLGEFIFLDFYRHRRPHPKLVRPFECTCGVQVPDCDFWRAVFQRLPEDTNIVVDGSNRSRILWVYRLMRYLSGRRGGDAVSPGDDHRVFTAILDAHGATDVLLCDTSKDFARLARLLMMPGIEVLPVHLVRDARAVAFSYSKKSRVHLGLKPMGFYKALWLWTGVNALTRLVLRLSGLSAVPVSYERFCQDPAAVLRDLNSRLGTNIPTDDVPGAIRALVSHEIGGNTVRFKPIAEIREDSGWRNAISAGRARVSGWFTGPLHRLWTRAPR
jgi:LPS sulfotransferase NodH